MSEIPHDDRQLERLSSALRTLARRLVLDDEAADDLVQEAWLAALQQSPERVRDLTGWLRTVLRNMAARHHARRARRREMEEHAARPEAEEGVGELAEQLTSLRILQRAAAALSEPYRSVIHLRFFEELSIAEICARLDRPSATVKSQVKRGLQKMRDQLDGTFHGDRRAWALTLLPAATPSPVRPVAALRRARAGLVCGAAATVAVLGSAIYLGLDQAPTPRPALPRVASAEPAARPHPSPPSRADGAISQQQASREPVAQPTTAAADTTRRILVEVQDASGAPLPGARVHIAGRSDAQTCDDTGRTELRIAPGEWPALEGATQRVALVARAPGHAESLEHQVLMSPAAAGAPTEPHPVRLQLRSPEVVVEAEVVDEEGQPIAGATIDTFGALVQDRVHEDGTPLYEPRRTVSTPPSGTVRIESLARVERVYHVSAPGYALRRHVEPALGADLRRLRFVLERGATLQGIVRDPDGVALANARIWTDVGPGHERNPAETRSDASGAYFLEGLDPGRHFLFASDPTDESWAAHLELELEAGEQGHWEAQLEQRAGVRLRCLFPDGSPLVAGGVILRPGDERVDDWVAMGRTDAQGRMVLRAVPDGPLDVFVMGPDFDETLRHALVVRAIEASFEERVLGVEQHEAPTGVVSGVFLDPDGAPPTDARLRLEAIDSSYHRRATTDETGAFQLTHVPEGRYELIGRLGGLGLAHLGTVDMPAGGAVELGVVSAPALSTIDVDWLWPDEATGITIQSGAWFPDRREAWRWQPILEGAPGPLPERLELLPGRHCIIVERGAAPPEQRFVFLEFEALRLVFGPEQVFPQRFRLVGAHPIQGGATVVVGREPDGAAPAPLATVDLSLLKILEESRVEPTTGEHRFELALPSGSYVIEAYADSGATGRRRLVLGDSPTTGSAIEITLE